MFKLNPNPTFKVEIAIPSPDGGGKITFECKHRSRKKLAELFKGIKDDSSDVQLLNEIIVGWSGVDVEYNLENLELLLDNYHGAATVIFNGYTRALAEGVEKNSKR